MYYTKATSLREIINLTFDDFQMFRFRQVFKEQKISWSDEVFAESVGWNWFEPRAELVSFTTKHGTPIKRGLMEPIRARDRVVGIYKSKNKLKNFLKCKDRWNPSKDQYMALAARLGFLTDIEITKLESLKAQHPGAYNKDFKYKRMTDLLPWLKSGGSRELMLEAAGYLRLLPDRTYVATAKALGSPRVELWEKYKADQNDQ